MYSLEMPHSSTLIDSNTRLTEAVLTCTHDLCFEQKYENSKKKQRTNGPVNAHLISWPSKAQNIQNLENIW